MKLVLLALCILSGLSQAFKNPYPIMIQAGFSQGYLSSHDATFQAKQLDLTISQWDTLNHWSPAVFISFTEPQTEWDMASYSIRPYQYVDIGCMQQWNWISTYGYVNLGAGLGIHYAESAVSSSGGGLFADSWLGAFTNKSIGLTAPLRTQAGVRWKYFGIGASANANLRYTLGIQMDATLDTSYGVRFVLFLNSLIN